MAEDFSVASNTTWQQCNGLQLRDLAQAGLAWLEHNCDHVNSLNVFPVPDGDTGTNMLLTMRSACERVATVEEAHLGKMARQIERGALMGARGNSGVILSQIWRGFARVVQDEGLLTAQLFADGLRGSAETAYKGVMTPVEGTILTIIRKAADAAEEAAQHRGDDLRYVLHYTIESSKQALEKTPEQLPILKQAGVVDSGGQGLIYIFEGMLRLMDGDLSLNLAPAAAAKPVTHTLTAQELARPEDGDIENPYDVQFILLGKDMDVLKVRADIDAMGDSTVVVGDSETIKVHVHVEDPGVPLSYGVSIGHITDVVVENMQEQMETIIAESHPLPAQSTPTQNGHVARNGHVSGRLPVQPTVQPGQIGIVAVAPGDGISQTFEGLGVAVVVNGGQTNNPSTEEIFQAIQDVPSDRVIVLPNNKNILMAAETARDLSPKSVVVIPTRTVPQGISAMVEYDLDGDLEAVAEAMREVIADVATGEITTAVRNVELDGVAVAEGQLIGIVDGKLRASGSVMPELLRETLTAMAMDEREMVTLFYGGDATEEEAETVADQITTLYPEVEVDLVRGGQPHYHYILGAE